MKRIVTLMMLLLLLVAGQTHAQSKRQLAKEKREAIEKKRKLKREQEEKAQEVQDSLNFVAALEAMNQREFTLEANQLMFPNGQPAYVNSNTNFISVHGNSAVVQIASNSGFSGPNGLGGVTVNGNITGYELQRDDEGNIQLNLDVMGAGISATVFISLPYGTNQASANINPNFNSNTLTMNGNIVPNSQSNVFQGTSLF